MSRLLGYVLDRPVNARGATGWDWLRGDVDGRVTVKQADDLDDTEQEIIDRINKLIPGRYEGAGQ